MSSTTLNGDPSGQRITPRTCPCCGHDNHTEPVHPYSREQWHLKSCASCHFVYLENAPAYELLDQEFEWKGALSNERARRRQEEPVLHAIQSRWKRIHSVVSRRDKLGSLIRQFFPPGPIVDIGCGSGKRHLRSDPGWIPFGIEISRDLAAAAHEIFSVHGGEVFNGPALHCLRQLEAERFTGAIMRAYLEHELNPKEVLAETRRVLKTGTHLIIKVPNYGSLNRLVRGHKWCGFRFPDHVNYFTPKSLRRLLENVGFVVARFQWTDHLPTSDNLWMVVRKQ